MDVQAPKDWHTLKRGLQSKERKDLRFKKREVWWCSLGENIGDEEHGKGINWTRPILITHKFNKHLFWGVPLTTQIKENPHYHHFHFNEKEQCAMLSQLRALDSKRILSRIGTITESDFKEITEKLKIYFS